MLYSATFPSLNRGGPDAIELPHLPLHLIFQSSFSSDSELTSLLFLFQADPREREREIYLTRNPANKTETDVTENQIPIVPTAGNISAYIELAVLVYLCSRISRRTRPGCPSSWKPAPPPYLGKIYQSFFFQISSNGGL